MRKAQSCVQVVPSSAVQLLTRARTYNLSDQHAHGSDLQLGHEEIYMKAACPPLLAARPPLCSQYESIQENKPSGAASNYTSEPIGPSYVGEAYCEWRRREEVIGTKIEKG